MSDFILRRHSLSMAEAMAKGKCVIHSLFGILIFINARKILSNYIQFIPCSPTNCLASCAQVRIVAVACASATMAIERMHVPYHMLEIYKKYNKFKYINMYLQPPTALSMAAEVGVASDSIAFTTPTLPILCALA